MQWLCDGRLLTEETPGAAEWLGGHTTCNSCEWFKLNSIELILFGGELLLKKTDSFWYFLLLKNVLRTSILKVPKFVGMAFPSLKI